MQHRRWITYSALLLGAFLLTFAALMPAVLLPSLKKIPLSAGGRTVTEVAPATLLDAKAFATGTVLPEHADNPACTGDNLPMLCFIGHNTEVQGVRNVAAVAPSGKQNITLRAGNVLLRQDLPEAEGLISASVDQVTLQRHSAFPVNKPVSTFHMTAPDLGLDDTTGAFIRDGLQYQFPFNTEQRSYPYFDTTAQASQQIDYVDEEQFHGRKVYKFSQDVGPVDMFNSVTKALQRDGSIDERDRGVLAGLKMRSTAGHWYSPEELQQRGLNPQDPVVMTRYYGVTRTLLVEPITGVIVRGEEQLHYFFAENDADAAQALNETSPYRTALRTTLAWDEQTQNAQFAKADDGANKLHMLKVIKYVAAILGALLLLVAWWRR